jgi:rhamnogalacturonan hydrolase
MLFDYYSSRPDFLNMFSKFFPSAFLSTILVSSLASATQIDKRSVGALTPLSSKTKVCNILDYGGVADNSTDIGPAIKSAFASCAISGRATIYIPPGSYSRKTTLRKLTHFNTNSPQFRQE